MVITNVIESQWIVVIGADAQLYTASNQKEIAIKKYQNRNAGRNTPKGFKVICADIYVKPISQ